jgi:chromosomal replication initiator protein
MSQVSEMLSTYRQVRHKLMGPPPKMPLPKLRRALPVIVAAPTLPHEPPTESVPTLDQIRKYRAGRVLTVNRIQHIVADCFGVTRADICGTERFQRVVWPRQVAVYIAKKLLPLMSLPELGRRFGKRDHTTMLHSVRVVARRVADSPCDAMEVFACERAILDGCEY